MQEVFDKEGIGMRRFPNNLYVVQYTRFIFIKKQFIRKQYVASQKAKTVQYWISET